MAKGKSRFTPQHRFWNEDLALRDAPVEGEALLGDDVVSMDETNLEITRATNIMRGVALMTGLAMVVAMVASAAFSAFTFQESFTAKYPEPLGIGITFLTLLVSLVGVPAGWWGIRLDLTMPRDTPIRFTRKTGKVQVLEFEWSWNPFARWPLQYKEFDWCDIQAEVQRQAGTDGRSYVVRYALVLCVCKPGTFEVVDRLTLKSNRIGSGDFLQIWNYLRRYMLEGPQNLSKKKPKPQGVSFRRSFFQYMRNVDPTQEGRDFRADCPWWLNVINGFIVLVAFWIIIPAGIFHYIAMRFAPEAKWPIDEGAKSA